MFNFGEYAEIGTSLWLLFVYKAAKHRYIFLRGVGLEI